MDSGDVAATAVPTEPATGATVTGMVLSHGGIPAGSGIAKEGLWVGGDGEDLRITCESPTSGKITVLTRHYLNT